MNLGMITIVSVMIAAVTKIVTAITNTADTSAGVGTSVSATLTQAGVFSVVLVVAYYLIRRSDDREAVAAVAARAELALERGRSLELATKLAAVEAEVTVLRAEVARLRNRYEQHPNF